MCRYDQTPALRPLLSRSQSRLHLTRSLTLNPTPSLNRRSLTRSQIRSQNLTRSRNRRSRTMTTTRATTMTKITITKDAMAKLAAMTTTTGSMTMTDDLVKRLRAAEDDSFVETLCGEAAERIEQLTAERDRLREALKHIISDCAAMENKPIMRLAADRIIQMAQALREHDDVRALNAKLREKIAREIADLPGADLRGVLRMIETWKGRGND